MYDDSDDGYLTRKRSGLLSNSRKKVTREMTKYLAILRGINVGGNRKILMNELKACITGLHFSEVSTYIQSGNVLFTPPNQVPEASLENTLEQVILETFGFAVPVIVRTVTEWQEVISQNPFWQTPVEHLHLTLLKEPPTPAALQKFAENDFSPDQFAVIGRHVFIFCAGKYSDSKLTNAFIEKKLQVQATTRNWQTVLKLAELAAL